MKGRAQISTEKYHVLPLSKVVIAPANPSYSKCFREGSCDWGQGKGGAGG